MIGTLILAAGGAIIIRHAWHWARHSAPTRILVQGCAPADLVLTEVQADRLARLACWAWRRPVVVATLRGRSCDALVYHPGGLVECRTLRPAR